MKSNEASPDSKHKSDHIINLTQDYTKKLKNHLKTGKSVPNPDKFMSKCANNSQKKVLREQLNTTTVLAFWGRSEYQKAKTALEKDNFLEKSKQRFLDKIKRAMGPHKPHRSVH